MVGWKFTQFLKSYSKPQVSIFLNFASLFSVSVMRDNSSVLLYSKLYIMWTETAHQNVKCQTFDCSREILPNLCFNRLLWLKAFKISAKKIKRSCVPWHWRMMQNLNKNQFVVSKTTKIWWFLIWALKNLKNLHFDWSLLSKVYTFDLKKYRGVSYL